MPTAEPFHPHQRISPRVVQTPPQGLAVRVGPVEDVTAELDKLQLEMRVAEMLHRRPAVGMAVGVVRACAWATRCGAVT